MTVRVDAVIYFQVSDPVRAAVDVQDYVSAIGQVAQTSCVILGKSNLDDLLSNREHLNQGLELMIDSPALAGGSDRPPRNQGCSAARFDEAAVARQAEAERERRARVITAEGELQASEKLAQAAEVMASTQPRCNCASWRPSSRSPQRRIPPWYFPSLSNCSDFWNAPHRTHPSAGTRPPVLTRAQLPTARRALDHHGFPTTPAAGTPVTTGTHSSGISNVRNKPDNYWAPCTTTQHRPGRGYNSACASWRVLPSMTRHPSRMTGQPKGLSGRSVAVLMTGCNAHR